jgi:hypothetical protein
MVKGDQQPEPDIQESEIEIPEYCHWPIPGIAATMSFATSKLAKRISDATGRDWAMGSRQFLGI